LNRLVCLESNLIISILITFNYF